MSKMSGATIEEYIEILNAEQHVELPKLRAYARHGVQPSVRGEVWLYLLGVLSDDKSQEMTSVRSKFLEYEGMHKRNPFLHDAIQAETAKLYKSKIAWRPPPDRRLLKSSHKIAAKTKLLHDEGAGANEGASRPPAPEAAAEKPLPLQLPPPLESPSANGRGLPPLQVPDPPTALAFYSDGDGSSVVSPVDLDLLEEDLARLHHPYQHIIAASASGEDWARTRASEGPSHHFQEGTEDSGRADRGLHSPASPLGTAAKYSPSAAGDAVAAAANAAASEEAKQRFCESVENVVCAYLNRSAWKAQLAHEQHRRLGREVRASHSGSTPPPLRARSDSASSASSFRGRASAGAGTGGELPASNSSRSRQRAAQQPLDLRPPTPTKAAHRSYSSSAMRAQSQPHSRQSSLGGASFAPSPTKQRFHQHVHMAGGEGDDEDEMAADSPGAQDGARDEGLAEREGDDLDLDWSIQRTTPGTVSSAAFPSNGAADAQRSASSTSSGVAAQALHPLDPAAALRKGSDALGNRDSRPSSPHQRFFHVTVPARVQTGEGTDAEPGEGAGATAQRNGAADAGQLAPRELSVPYPVHFHPAFVNLCVPFVQCIKVEAGMFFAFERLMLLIEDHNRRAPLASRVATFLTLFRATLPELFAYFEEEEVDTVWFAGKWMQNLLAKEMRLNDLMRLWDTYFAMPDFLDLHVYVCVAILMNSRDSLEELDQSEIKSMLSALPPLDVNRIINDAINIRLSHQQSQLL